MHDDETENLQPFESTTSKRKELDVHDYANVALLCITALARDVLNMGSRDMRGQ